MTEIANTYGQALYDLAKDENLTEELLGQLTMLKDIFAAEPSFVQLLCIPSIAKQERCQVLDDSLRTQVHPYVLNFLKILTEKGYVRHFSGCCQVFKKQFNKDHGILPVTAVTTIPLSDELREKLIQKLESVTGKRVELECRVDPECLGGVRLDLDGMQLDGTVRRRLDEIRNILKSTVL